MKLASLRGRLVLVRDDGVVDVADASGGRFSPDPQSIYERWDELLTWSAPSTATQPLDPGALDAPVPRPRQVFAIGDIVEQCRAGIANEAEGPARYDKCADDAHGGIEPQPAIDRTQTESDNRENRGQRIGEDV